MKEKDEDVKEEYECDHEAIIARLQEMIERKYYPITRCKSHDLSSFHR